MEYYLALKGNASLSPRQAGPRVPSTSEEGPPERQRTVQRFRGSARNPKHIVQDGTVGEVVGIVRGLQELSVLSKFAGTPGILRYTVETVKLSVVCRDWQGKGNE